jgi:hypothetical protein
LSHWTVSREGIATGMTLQCYHAGFSKNQNNICR